MALALKAMFTSGRYDAFFERTRGITGLNMKRSDFRFMNIVSFLRIESACLYAYSFHIFGWIRKKKNLFFGFFFSFTTGKTIGRRQKYHQISGF